MKIEGGCFCGAIHFEAEVNPATVTLCHCSDCQVTSGAPYRVSVPAKAENFKITGTPKIHVKTADSGNRRNMAFCAECGTQIYSSPAEPNPGVFILRIGTVRQRAELAPQKQIWCDSALAWSDNIADLERFARQAPVVPKP